MVSPFVSDEHREAFARYGRAHYAIQTLEYELVNTYGVLSLLPERKEVEDEAWEGRVDEFFDTTFTHTFGTMLGKIRKTGVVPDDLIARLEACKPERDFLVHRFFRFYIDGGADDLEGEMISRSDAAYDVFMALNHDLETFSLGLAEHYGITPQMINDEVGANRRRHQRPEGA